jgi:hypothetical protein
VVFRLAVIAATAIGKRAEFERYVAEIKSDAPVPPVTSAGAIAEDVAASHPGRYASGREVTASQRLCTSRPG